MDEEWEDQTCEEPCWDDMPREYWLEWQADGEWRENEANYYIVATDLYLLLRQFVGDPWRLGLGLDEVDFNPWTYVHVGRRRALCDRRWLNGVDGDLWHDTMVRVLE